jgi:hypothetical protein
VEETRHVSVAQIRARLDHSDGDRLIRFRDGASARIVWSRLKFGWRPWFECPGCKKRAGRLYAVETRHEANTDRARWLCRTCAGLDYRSQRNQLHQRHVARANAIRRRLGQIAGWMGAPIPPPPPRMHIRTYARLIRELQEHERLALDVIGPRLSRSVARLRAKFGL